MSQKEASYLTGGFFQNLDQDDELQNLIGLGKVGKIAGKAGKAYLTKGLFQNLEQQDDLQNLITLKGAGKLAGKAKAAGFFQNLDAHLI